MEIKPSQLSRFSTDNRKRVKGSGRYTPFGMKLTVPAGYGRLGDERGRLTLVRPSSAIPGPAWPLQASAVYGGGRGARVLRLLVRSPLPVFRTVFGTEWFAEPGGRTGELVG